MKKAMAALVLGFFALAGAAQAQVYTAPAYPYYPQPSYPSYPGSCPTLSYNLYRGLFDYHTGGQVSQLQQFLANRYPGQQAVTGYFGNQTFGNVARFQREQAVYPITGGVGPLTRAAIARVCQGGTVPPIFASFTASPTQGQAPLPVTFSVNTYTGNAQNELYIDFGDGQTGNPSPIYCFAAPCNPAMSASHTYAQSGTYVAKLYQNNNYCPPGNYCALVYREPTLLGTVTILVSGGSSMGISAYPTSGQAPLTVTFTPNTSGYYAVDFGDGQSASLLQGSVQHTYWHRNTYTAQFMSDAPCLHGNPRCMIAQQSIGSATITVY